VSLIWLEAVLGAVVPLAWGGWQLHALRRDRLAAERRAAAAADVAGTAAPSPSPAPPAAPP
jgi:hypothetical protein